ncbi:hypothetical protein [Bradyrhizobium septentrionale]|uniref:Uncharacterized protein n=2 Tax=Bradyrhizobium septentrionale TaxID=1404411 RepID=A0ABZ2NR83_9BRAD|nr:hypothetical protein [Bradyrhizobium septentrionale]UGY13526.1 hypothetical protein HAP48_0033810 [Bradyrhizobium septentrionale]UGY22168.1 hypothetical protein HU675_0029765 [Bradyrhizobium septentrionale]
MNMTNEQDTSSKVAAEPRESSEDGAQNAASKVSPAADALSDSSLDDVSGGSWPFSSAARASYSVNGPTG